MDQWIIVGIVAIWMVFIGLASYRWGLIDGFQDGYETAQDDHADAVRFFLGED